MIPGPITSWSKNPFWYRTKPMVMDAAAADKTKDDKWKKGGPSKAILRSDNGGKYTSEEFVNFCRDVGIKRELTTPYNPQQNGVAERKNRTIMEVVKTMIHDQDLTMCLWAEASMISIYVQNWLSHSALGFKTLEEMFTRNKPEVSHLKIFGCPIFIHISKEKRNKLEPPGKKGIFVGYCEVSSLFVFSFGICINTR